MRFICYPLLIALFCTSGCMSNQLVERAKGYTTDRVEPRAGDTVFLHGGLSYVAQQKRPEKDVAGKMSPMELRQYPPPYYAFSPCPGCYAFFLVTVPMDAVTLPFQAIGCGLAALMYSNATHF